MYFLCMDLLAMFVWKCLPRPDVSGQKVLWMCLACHNNNPCHIYVKHKWIPRRKYFLFSSVK